MRCAAVLVLLASACAWAQPQVVVAVPLPVEANSDGLRGSQLGFGWSVGNPVSRFVYGSRNGQVFGGNAATSNGNRSFLYSGYGYYGYGIGNGFLVRSGPQNSTIPVGPSYANPGAVAPVAEQAVMLEAPSVPNTTEWSDVRTSFDSASASVSSARTAIEELRSRLAALGQSPRANLLTSVATAESALKQAQTHMSAGELDGARTETQRASYIARQVLKEFGR